MKIFKYYSQDNNYHFYNYGEFINESTMPQMFKRFYLLVNRPYSLNSDNPIGKAIGSVRDMLFDQITIDDNYKKITFDKDIPILNFNSKYDIINSMVNDNILDESLLYNNTKGCILADNKIEFHKKLIDETFMPVTVFTRPSAYNLNFPIISKPKSGSSAKGIKKFDSIDDLKASDDKFDVFSELIDIKNEYRAFCFNNKILVLNERLAKEGSSDFLANAETETDFIYNEIELSSFKKHSEINKIMDKCRSAIALDFYSLDFVEDSKGKLYLIELNSCTGMGVDKMIKLYKAVHNDFYNTDVDDKVNEKFNKLTKEWYKVYKNK